MDISKILELFVVLYYCLFSPNFAASFSLFLKLVVGDEILFREAKDTLVLKIGGISKAM